MCEEWTTPEDRSEQYQQLEKRDKSKGHKLFDKYNKPGRAVPPKKSNTGGNAKLNKGK